MLVDEIEKINIPLSLRIFEPSDLATGWEVESIVGNPDIFEDLYEKYPLNKIENFDDYYLYLLSLKLQSLSKVIPILAHEEHKIKIKALSTAAEDALRAINPGSVIKFINKEIDKIFSAEIAEHDIRIVTLDLIAKYNTGISKETFSYLCEHFGYLLIDRFDDFESVFEREPDLFDVLFPSGKLDDISPYRFEDVLCIWQHINQKGKSNLKDSVTRKIPIIFDDVVSLSNSATIDNIIRIEPKVRKFYQFLQMIKSPLANQFAQYAKKTEDLLSKNIMEQGHLFKYEIPVKKIVERLQSIEAWEQRMLYITHDFVEDGQISAVSRLNKMSKPISSTIDLVSTNIPTDDYYTMSHQQMLGITASIGIGTIFGILSNQTACEDYFSLVLSAIKFISEQLNIAEEGLEQDTEQILTMVQLMIDNHDADKKIVHSLCYGAAMFICAFIEKFLRLFYFSMVKDRQYVPSNIATLGDLLNENNKDILSVFGESHIKNLTFFLMQTLQKHIGYNIRNNLAHWSNLSVNILTPTYVEQLLWLLTDIINTVFWHLLKEKIN